MNESLPASCERGGDPKWRLEKRKEEKLSSSPWYPAGWNGERDFPSPIAPFYARGRGLKTFPPSIITQTVRLLHLPCVLSKLATKVHTQSIRRELSRALKELRFRPSTIFFSFFMNSPSPFFSRAFPFPFSHQCLLMHEELGKLGRWEENHKPPSPQYLSLAPYKNRGAHEKGTFGDLR